MLNGLLQYDTCIAFKLHNFFQVTFYHQCDQLCNTPPIFKKYVIEPKGFLGYPTKGIACALNILNH